MELKLIENSILARIGSEEIGNGGNSRLDIMLDTSSGEVWADEYYDHGSNSWTQYDDEDIICVGKATNYGEDEDGEDEDGEDLDYLWTIEIYAPDQDRNESEFLYGHGDYAIDVDEILKTIKEQQNLI